MSEGSLPTRPPLGDKDLWVNDDFTATLCDTPPKVYGAGLFCTISLALLFVLGVEKSDHAKLARQRGIDQSEVTSLTSAAFACINNVEVNYAFRATLSGASHLPIGRSATR